LLKKPKVEIFSFNDHKERKRFTRTTLILIYSKVIANYKRRLFIALNIFLTTLSKDETQIPMCPK